MPSTQTHSAARVVAQLLIDLGLGTEPELGLAWPVYATSEPDVPDNVITVMGTQGRDRARLNPGGELTNQPGVSIRVRAKHSTGEDVSHAKAAAIRFALVSISAYDRTVTVTDAGANISYVVHALTRVGQVLELGRDLPSARGRRVFTLNATVSLRQLT